MDSFPLLHASCLWPHCLLPAAACPEKYQPRLAFTLALHAAHRLCPTLLLPPSSLPATILLSNLILHTYWALPPYPGTRQVLDLLFCRLSS